MFNNWLCITYQRLPIYCFCVYILCACDSVWCAILLCVCVCVCVSLCVSVTVCECVISPYMYIVHS